MEEGARHFLRNFGILFSAGLFFWGCGPGTSADLRYNFGGYESAIPWYEKHLTRNPDDWNARTRLGHALYETGQFDRAIAEFQAVLDRRPGIPDATYYLGLAQLAKDDRQAAVDAWADYRNPKKPTVGEAIARQRTLVQISESIRLARQALQKEAELQTRPPDPNAVAVFAFQDVTPESRFPHLQKALAAMIISDLSAVPGLRVLERVRVQYLQDEMELGESGIVAPGTAPRAGRLLGAENVVVGTLESGSLATDTSVASASAGDVVENFTLSCPQERFFELQKAMVERILLALRVRETPETEEILKDHHTQSLPAATFFGQGLDAQDAGRWKDARRYYRKALEEDPGFRLAARALHLSPGADAPGLSALRAMSAADLAGMVEDGVEAAESADAPAEAAATTGGVGAGQSPGSEDRDQAPAIGGIGVSW
jgi:tetratricopeptide (TPR) repeat protein